MPHSRHILITMMKKYSFREKLTNCIEAFLVRTIREWFHRNMNPEKRQGHV